LSPVEPDRILVDSDSDEKVAELFTVNEIGAFGTHGTSNSVSETSLGYAIPDVRFRTSSLELAATQPSMN
jgi:hypothetical protein